MRSNHLFFSGVLLVLGASALPLGCSGEGPLGGEGGGAPAVTADAKPLHARPATVVASATINFQELADREAREGAPQRTAPAYRGRMPVPRGRASALASDPPRLPIEPSLLPPVDLPAPGAPSPKAPASIGASFLGLADDNTAIPPDTMGAVGPNHVMTTLNSQVRIQTRAGATLSTVSLESFWASTGATGIYDPKIVYDPYNNRWIFVAPSDAESAAASLLVGATATSDPTGVWHLYRIDGDATDQVWLDYPSLGFNKTWVSVTLNLFTINTDNFTQSGIFLIDKASLYAGGPSIGSTMVGDPSIQDTLSPAETFDNAISTLYYLQMWDGNTAGNGTLRLYTVTGPVGAEVLTPVTFISTPNPWGSGPNGSPNFAPQQGTNQKISTNDDRLFNTVYRNGSLWTSHTIFLPANNPTRASIQWWQVSTAGAILQRGRIDDPTAAVFHAFPSISVNKNDDMLLGYTRFSTTSFASAYFSFHSVADAASTVQADTLIKAGEATYFKTFGGQENRWGDYSHTVIDPVDDTAFWTVQEYAAAHVGNQSRWGTWWGQIIPPVVCGANGASCDDGNACTMNDTCQAGVCVAGPAVVCPPAADTCHVAGVCSPATGVCSAPTVKPDGTACNDGNGCTSGDSCQAGVCAGAPVVCPAPDACHLAGACVPATGLCAAGAAKPNGTACDDGNGCTQGDACQNGVCTGTAVVCPPAVDSCHVAGTCAPATGMCSAPTVKPNGTACDDGNGCTSGETCQAGVCAGSPVICPAVDACHTAGACNPATGTCIPGAAKPNGTACNDGNGCTQNDTCQNGTCTGGAAVVCPPAVDACHVAGVCNVATGLCSAPTVKPNGTACNDGNACTQNDTCQNGTCTGTSVICPAVDACHQSGACNPVTGMCTVGPIQPNGTSCSDGNGCTLNDTCQTGICTAGAAVLCPPAADDCHLAGICVPATGVCSAPTVKPNGTGCNDGNACTQGDTCQNGTCTGGAAVVCPPADACHQASVCNAATGACGAQANKPEGTPCDDGNACTKNDTCHLGACTAGPAVVCVAKDACHAAGVCNVATGVCSDPLVANGTPCDDGNACTQNDTCQNGVCTGGAAVVCPPADACHQAGVCDPATGTCAGAAKPDGTPCNDGSACTQGDTCKGGVCAGGAQVICTPLDICHVAGTCNPASGLCDNPAKPDGAPCDDGNLCTQNDACKVGMCTGGVPVACPPADACHLAGVCDPKTGACTSTPKPDGTFCDDGNPCTQGEVCKLGTCGGGAQVVCPAPTACHQQGVCDPASGLCTDPIALDGTSCNDGNACTTNDLCKGGMCVPTGNVVCPPSSECEVSAGCDVATGACIIDPKPDGTPCSIGTCQGGTCTAGTSSSSSSSSSSTSSGTGGSTGAGTTSASSSGAGGDGTASDFPQLTGRACTCELAGAGEEDLRPALGLLALMAAGLGRRRRKELPHPHA